MPTLRERARRNPFIAKRLFRLQVFLLRHNLAKRLGTIAMVLTTTGRTTGKKRSTPVGYLRDGDSVLAFTFPHHHWYKNLRRRPEASLVIQGVRIPARAEFVDDDPCAPSRPTSASARDSSPGRTSYSPTRRRARSTKRRGTASS